MTRRRCIRKSKCVPLWNRVEGLCRNIHSSGAIEACCHPQFSLLLITAHTSQVAHEGYPCATRTDCCRNLEIQRAPFSLHTRTRGLHLHTCGDQAAFVKRKFIVIHGKRHMAVRTPKRLALHKRQSYTTEQEKHFARQGELTIFAAIDFHST